VIYKKPSNSSNSYINGYEKLDYMITQTLQMLLIFKVDKLSTILHMVCKEIIIRKKPYLLQEEMNSHASF